MPKCRDTGHGETRPEAPRWSGTGAGSGIHHSVALRVGVPRLARQRNSGRHVARRRWGGRTPLFPPREKQGTEPAAAPGEAPLWQKEARRREGHTLRPSPRNLGTLRGLAPCLRGCVSPGSVTKAWKPQDAHPRRNLPTGSAFSASSEETNRQKNKLLVPLQNCVHQVSGQEPSLAFTIHSPHYRRSKDASGRAGAARMTCQSNPFQLQEHNVNPGSPPLSELSMLLVSRSSPFLLKPRLKRLGS